MSIRHCLALVLLAAGAARGDDGAAPRAFTLDVLPVLKAKCFGCHGDDAKGPKGGLDVRTRAGLLKGGDSGEPSVVPRKPADSPLVKAVAWEDGVEMPPKANDRLTAPQVEAVRRWVAAGAPWPDEAEQKRHRDAERAAAETADGVIVATSGGLADEWTFRRYKPDDLWAYRPVRKPAVPAGAHPVDAFVDARREAAGYGPAPQADPLTLVRRATFDLTGLPPTPEEVDAFRTASARDPDEAWAGLIDRLLASPRYGERWAQHWLDVARYADTGGYSNDYERSNAWRYRDYVIRSFNADKPYDRFVVEQLAGDELADASVRERTGDEAAVRKARLSGDYTAEESEWLVATGFLRMGPWDNAMVMPAEARQIYLDDVVNSVGVTFLSTAMRCCKCHDHKFDPIPTRDYYRVYAAFAGTQMAERPVPFLPAENRAGFAEGKAFVERMRKFAVGEKTKLVGKREAAAKAWYAEHNRKYLPEAERKNLPDEEKPPRHVGLNHVEEGQLKVREQDEWIWTRALERYQPMAQAVYNGEDVKYQTTAARKLRMKPDPKADWRPVSVIYTGGALEAPGQGVTPGVLSGTGLPAPGAGGTDPYHLPDALGGRRLALAKWVADPRNPLATRSIVNRVWQHHFVHALAGNPNNFGVKGAKPTHPGLLDFLAADFVENGWALKRLHRLVMTSRAYRQAGTHPRIDDLRAKDPDNKLLAYHPARHLTAEELRDAMLAATGELNAAAGGLPAMPEINMEVALQPRMIQFSLAPAYQPSPTPAERNRRTVYAYRVRGMPDPFLELFNQPNPNESCELRDSAPVAPQAFTLFNSDAATDRSVAFALRLEKDGGTTAERIDRAFRLALGRPPRPVERERLAKYVADMTAYHRAVGPKPAAYPTRITRSLVEEFSGKMFEYDEILPRFEAYRPDPKPADVTAETRALADACLLLFNGNEFIYLR